MADPEEWRPIPDWPEYSVSNHSRVRSEPRTVARSGPVPSSYTVAGKVLRPNRSGGVNLSRPGARASVRVRTLAILVFGGPPSDG